MSSGAGDALLINARLAWASTKAEAPDNRLGPRQAHASHDPLAARASILTSAWTYLDAYIPLSTTTNADVGN